MYGILAALGQATGFVFSKQGLLGDFSPFQGNVIRMLAAALVLWLIAGFQKQAGVTIQTLKHNPSALKLLALAAFIGPVLGVTSSLLAVQHAEVGVASVLTSLSPIFLLPVSYFVFKERIGWQAVAGTVLAMLGVFLLFLV
jgi:drug/metabolite transporter (DMT)-like permease